MEKENQKIYTKGGDTGKTSLIGGTRVPKNDIQVEAYGTIDELKSYLGLVYDFTDDLNNKKNLLTIIEKLFVIECMIACDSHKSLQEQPQIDNNDIIYLEQEIDKMTKLLKPLKSFILPGGHPLISHCHIARTICRRAERKYLQFCELNNEIEVISRYLNRLSDYLFTLSRYNAKILDIDELLWENKD